MGQIQGHAWSSRFITWFITWSLPIWLYVMIIIIVAASIFNHQCLETPEISDSKPAMSLPQVVKPAPPLLLGAHSSWLKLPNSHEDFQALGKLGHRSRHSQTPIELRCFRWGELLDQPTLSPVENPLIAEAWWSFVVLPLLEPVYSG